MRLELPHRFRLAEQPSDLHILIDDLANAIKCIPPEHAKRFRALRRVHDILDKADRKGFNVMRVMELATLLPQLQHLARQLEELSQTEATVAKTSS